MDPLIKGCQLDELRCFLPWNCSFETFFQVNRNIIEYYSNLIILISTDCKIEHINWRNSSRFVDNIRHYSP